MAEDMNMNTPVTPAPGGGDDVNLSGGFGALLDFSFKRFITLGFIKVIYILNLLAIALYWLVALIAAFSLGGAIAGIGVLILGPIFAVLAAIGVRMMLELIVVIFRIGENTSIIARNSEK